MLIRPPLRYPGVSASDGNTAAVVAHSQYGVGAVWVLSKDSNGDWSQTPFQAEEDDIRWGWDVAVNGDVVVVGVPRFPGGGAAVVLARGSSGGWYKQTTLLPEDAVDSDAQFGISVDISDCGCYIAVG
mmetsp:Transcript_10569/g.22742  ORF Transcript_10569/g.22742 Transcript_10569/m.22742 type:complete len:128 (-) Transcript_10569:1088-1471(-)|eukprot:CAMPEP_0183720228 /NCGR_PEP_ID=MMETSP0737-20130205/12908_1 /TAXON_ID=385413 /ORGANISM="Thalassiosira miniscula, Strain CCMP1093" /LENGTH=127 /DNA_ID=CAMNT_0025950067 /DNA_START=101 /DNA_END=484 /DNA_ORIENTATION=+